MQTKYRLPKDIYQATLWIIRGQQRRIEEYKRKKDDILNGGGASYIKQKNRYTDEFEYIYLPKSKTTQSSVEIKGMALAALDDDESTKKMLIVEQALKAAVSSYSEPQRISAALMKNIENRHEYPYRCLGNLPLSEKEFYALKAKFIYFVAFKLELI